MALRITSYNVCYTKLLRYEIANRKEILFSVKDKTNLNAWFDAEIVERIIYNLLSNAFKFTPNGGHVTLEVEKAGTYVEIIVRDTGSGIPPEVVITSYSIHYTKLYECRELRG